MASSSNLHRRSGAKTISEPARSIREACGAIERVDGLGVRPWAETDAPVLLAVWNDPVISRWNPVPPDPSLEFAASWIRGTSSQTVASIGIDVVVIDAEGNVVGEVGLQVDPAQGVAELGFWLHADARGRGCGRALLIMAERLGEQLELAGLVALTDALNDAANALLEKAGWTEVPTTSARRAFARRLG